MRKLILSLLVLPCVSYAGSLDMNNLYCGDLKINSATTLKQVEDKCQVKKEYDKTYNYELGMYEIKFVNTATNDKVRCDFPRDEPTSPVNGCR